VLAYTFFCCCENAVLMLKLLLYLQIFLVIVPKSIASPINHFPHCSTLSEVENFTLQVLAQDLTN
jgi:hypothetical protein